MRGLDFTAVDGDGSNGLSLIAAARCRAPRAQQEPVYRRSL